MLRKVLGIAQLYLFTFLVAASRILLATQSRPVRSPPICRSSCVEPPESLRLVSVDHKGHMWRVQQGAKDRLNEDVRGILRLVGLNCQA